jgi:hypothetical protein
MVEGRRRSLAWACVAAAVGLCWLPLMPQLPMAWLGPMLAQPVLALGWSGVRGSRDLGRPAYPLSADIASLATLWWLSFALLALTIAWPLQALRESTALTPALVLSFCLGCVFLGLWRLWPAYVEAARQGQSFSRLVLASPGQDAVGPLAGLTATLWVFVVLLVGLALSWPGLLLPTWRNTGLWLFPALAWLAHARLHHRAGPVATAGMISPADSDAEQSPPDAAPGTPDERLYDALRKGRVELAMQALAAGANPHALPDEADHDQRTLPMLAVLQGDLRLLRALIASGVDLNQAHGGLTPLLAATRDSWHGRPEAVMTLLANGADPRSADTEGNTALHHAARSTDPAVAALMLDAGALVDALNGEGFSPLGIACAAGNWRLARFLIEHGARTEPVDGQPALLAAAAGEDDPAGVLLLLRHKARVDARGQEQRTALMQACASGNDEIASALLDAGADRNAHDGNGNTPLLEAARHGQAATVTRLAAARPDVRAKDKHGRNALMLAALAGAGAEVMRQLLTLGVPADEADADGQRAIDIAIAHGRWPEVAVLDPGYPLPANIAEGLAAGGFEQTPRQLLFEALLASDFAAADALLGLGAALPPSLLAELLPEFATDTRLLAFAWLCRHGASIETPQAVGDSILFRLLDRAPEAISVWQFLLERGQSVAGLGGLARFLSGCLKYERSARNVEQFALGLLERGADPFAAGPDDDAPLLLAIRLGWQRMLDALLALGVDPNQRSERGHVALLVATMLGREAAVRALIRAGARPGARSPDGQSALGIALAAGHADLGRWLEWPGWALPGRALRGSDLPAAAMAGDLDAVVKLIELGLPVDATDAQTCTALLRAAGGGQVEIVVGLLARNADWRLRARTGATPLTAAISMRHAGVVEQLLRAGADPDQTLPGGVTPLMLAAALGQTEIAGRLLGHGARADAVDEQGLNALHCAALHAFSARDQQRVLALFDLLLMTDIAPDAANDRSYTPILLLLGARAEIGAVCDEDLLLAALERLLAEGVALDSQDARGLTALHLAALHGLPRMVQRLLREGADRNLRDHLGRTAQELAVMRGYVDIASEFETTRSSSPARFLRDG